MQNDREDAFGHALYDYLSKPEGRRPLQVIVERDDGSFYTYGVPSFFRRFGEWPSHEKKAMRYVRGRVLDVGTGAGRVALHLQGKGIGVVGIDESPLAIEVCRRRGLINAIVSPVERLGMDMGPFQTVIMFGSLFFGDVQHVRRILNRLARATDNRGRIIAEWGYDTESDLDDDDLSYRRHNLQSGRPEGLSRIRLRYKKFVSPWFSYLAGSDDELDKALLATRWRLKEYIESGESRHVAIIDKR